MELEIFRIIGTTNETLTFTRVFGPGKPITLQSENAESNSKESNSQLSFDKWRDLAFGEERWRTAMGC
jgi:hypothetical protein